MYVVLELVKLRQRHFSLKSRTKAIRNAKPPVSHKEAEGYELQSGTPLGAVAGAVPDEAAATKVKELRGDWADFKNAVITNAYVLRTSLVPASSVMEKRLTTLAATHHLRSTGPLVDCGLTRCTPRYLARSLPWVNGASSGL
jgi:hypothetical protein